MSSAASQEHQLAIECRDVSVRFGATEVLQRLNFDLREGEICAIIGPSGCGKSTLLRSIAGLQSTATGTIRCKGKISFVFQDATLLPWRTAFENVRLPYEVGAAKSANGNTIADEVRDLLGQVSLEESAFQRLPNELSGGMRMRTSLARGLAGDPDVLLLDEPFAALDDLLRSRLNDLLLELASARTRTIAFITHNIAEAAYLSHSVAILSGGIVAEKIDNPLPWPRHKEMRSSEEFGRFYGELSNQLNAAASP